MTRALFSISLLLLIGFWCFPSQARDVLPREKQTSGKDIYLLFHKMTGRKPDFVQAITSSEKYKAASLSDQKIMSINFVNGMINDFEALDIEKTLITIRTRVNIKTDFEGLRLKAKLVNQADKTADIYFPYTWGNMNFAVIPDKIESFLEIPMDLDQLRKIEKLNGGMAPTLVIRMVPVSADGKAPIEMDGMKQWLLLSKIVSVEYRNDQGQPIWNWADNKYARTTNSEIYELKK